MKYSLALVSAFAAASLAGPIETRQSKKPFIDSLTDGEYFAKCAWKGQEDKLPKDSEACLGTLRYCTMKKYEAAGERFDSPKACVDSREPPAFKEPASAENQLEFCNPNAYSAQDEWRKTSERCLGTVGYCNGKHYDGKAETYANSEECIATRQKTKPALASATAAAELPTEAELCPPFNGNREACIAETRTCLGQHTNKNDVIQCVHAAAAAAAAQAPQDLRAKEDEICSTTGWSKYGVSEADCRRQVVQCVFEEGKEDKNMNNFDTVVKCVDSKFF